MDWKFLAENLPHLTAGLNATATLLLALGFISIRKGRAREHKKWMLAALATSALFLVLYLFHKVSLYQAYGVTNRRFPRDAAPAAVVYLYFALLISHLVLAITVPFLAVRAVFLAMKGRIVAHKKLVRFAYPIWMYVSITGVLVYLMLYQFYPVELG